jgi:uncharacterized protein (TIGR03435 family)
LGVGLVLSPFFQLRVFGLRVFVLRIVNLAGGVPVLFNKRCFPLVVAIAAAVQCQAQPTTFEVASVKISPPFEPGTRAISGCNGGPGTSDAGLFVCRYSTLQTLAIEAFDLNPYQFPYSESADHTVYDIEAKIAGGATRDQFRGMLRALLIERLKLAYHFEKKPAQVYSLGVATTGAKLRETPPDSAEGPRRVAGPAVDEYGFRNPPVTYQGQMIQRSSEVVRWVGRGVTTSQIAKMLAVRLDAPVGDETGLMGMYGFTLYFSAGVSALSSGPVTGGSGPTSTARKVGAEAAEGVSLPSLSVVLRDKLGLTLEKRQGFVDVFVVDHVERVPVAN